VEFILELGDAVKSKPLSAPCTVSPVVQTCVGILDTLDEWIDQVPPTDQPTRYGNQAFRAWYTVVEKGSVELMNRVSPEHANQMAPYLVSSVGNYTRIDYGTGHEASFAMWMYCLKVLNLVTPNDYFALVSKLFVRYLSLMRKLQTTYFLEPAGSHGVWGLDDYQFLPFVWGSAQLIDHPQIKPNSIHNLDIVNTYSDEYLYLGCVRFINQMKKGPFGEHSPYLNDISHVPHQLWQKVNFGMMKMYQQEVLNKFPVIQHFLFGSLIPFE